MLYVYRSNCFSQCKVVILKLDYVFEMSLKNVKSQVFLDFKKV